VPLEERRSDLEVDLALDGAPDDRRLVLAGGDDHDLARGEDRRDAHRHRLARHVLLAEEVGGRVEARDVVEVDDARAALDPRARLVEADVPGLADAQQLEVDAARRAIAASYARFASSTASRGSDPSGRCTFAGSMSTCENRFSHMNRRYE
jgi:hypothetical protein